MTDHRITALLIVASILPTRASADDSLLKTHCGKCHTGPKPKGDFDLRTLGTKVRQSNRGRWTAAMEYVRDREMPPPKDAKLTNAQRQELLDFFGAKIRAFHHAGSSKRTSRRLNNREFANSVRDVLMIEDIGTNQPMANLLGDGLQNGFDTDGDTLGVSRFHLEQYIAALRNILDATILVGDKPPSRRYVVSPDRLRPAKTGQRQREARVNRTSKCIEFLDPRIRVYFANFATAPHTGRYKITIRAMGVDRGVYDASETGIYRGDPIRLQVHLGDRKRTFDLADGKMTEIKLDEWIAAGTRIELSYPTDGLRFRGNGNFKFQYSIAHDYLKKNNPALYRKVVEEDVPKSKRRRGARHWSHWTDYWQGPRPRLFGAVVEGPFYESWPPKRHVALLGKKPTVGRAAAILKPIAERAWRRKVSEKELVPIVRLVQSHSRKLGDIEALKEGVVAILVSPSFLLINSHKGTTADRFATKFSYFLSSSIPSAEFRAAVRAGKLDSLDDVQAEVARRFKSHEAGEFVRTFPHAWLQLDRINFMAPDPDRYPLYHRKHLSEDMIAEVRRFFRHAIDNNIPIPEFLSADYSFLNADLAKVYGAKGVVRDSQLRKYTFKEGRRGGLLGMGAFLTLTADTLSTSPIHRAVYVMENFLGVHPAPPPADVNITEPDVRQARTIKEILNAHKANKRCAACHKRIDPFGYAFENFGPMGEWRDHYTEHIGKAPNRKQLLEIEMVDRKRSAKGLPPVPKPWTNKPIRVDASSTFRNGTRYRNIIEYRKLMSSAANRERFVRCFIRKLLAYANGGTPADPAGIEKILSVSKKHDYRIVETIAAVIHSPLFRGPSGKKMARK